MDYQINRFFNNFYRLFKIYLFFLAVFTLFRIWFFIRLGDFKELVKIPGDVIFAFLRGMQFDTMIICYSLLIPFLVYFSEIFIKNKEYQRRATLFVVWYCGFSIALSAIILFVDQYYYNYFQTHISVIIFGLADDDSQTVMSSVWTDYPIIRIAIAWIGMLLGFRYYLKRKVYALPDFNINLHVSIKSIGVLLIMGVYFLGIRESVGIFPLQIHDSEVSDNKFVNFLTINGIYALKSSYVERKKSENIIENELNSLQLLGYSNPIGAARDYFADDSTQLSDSTALDKLFSKTPKNAFLEREKPNVVFVFMESMSNYNINFDSEKMNLLGSLRPHFQSDYLFRNFVSSGNITIQSLEYLMVNSPVSLSQTKYRFTRFPSSVAVPFSNSGYNTKFITGGKANWRAMDEFAANQRFDEIKGMAHIQAELKKCKSNKWGVYDEYLFEYVFDKLSQKDSKPKFFFVQTTTNHTPFELPTDYKPYKISLSDSLKERLLVTEELAVKNLNAYQYSNNSLGNFLNKIKNSDLGKNTIVVMTGDHNNLMLFDFDETRQLQQRGVPLYMYVPEKYQPKTPVNTSVFASHKDIFPTIFNLSLSNKRYFSIGNNLMEAPANDTDKYFGINIGSHTAFSYNAAVNYSASKAFYNWKDKKDFVLGKVTASAQAEELLKRSRSNYALSMFYILNQIGQSQASRQVQKTKLAKL
ncbi:MAG: sulfatase-like hydrolase/transferase [Sphingobacteriaceae bacterium]|nr:sulfatase-like hydrolase/transferase [Sphingobacteriaceae bacterium]